MRCVLSFFLLKLLDLHLRDSTVFFYIFKLLFILKIEITVANYIRRAFLFCYLLFVFLFHYYYYILFIINYFNINFCIIIV